MNTEFKPLTHHDKRFAHGYRLRILSDKKGDYHIVIGYDSEAVGVYKMTHVLKNDPTMSELSLDEFEKLYADSVRDGSEYKPVYGEEYNSVLAAFDFSAFGDEDPIYKDEVYSHLSDLNDFYDFCEECERRRKPDCGIGIGMDDVAWCGKKMIPCSAFDRLKCLTLWAVRNSHAIRRCAEPDFYKETTK